MILSALMEASKKNPVVVIEPVQPVPSPRNMNVFTNFKRNSIDYASRRVSPNAGSGGAITKHELEKELASHQNSWKEVQQKSLSTY